MAVDSRNPEFLVTTAAEPVVAVFATASNKLLVAAARRGDRAAWDELVERYGGLIEGVTRSYRLGDEDARDVTQVVWLALLSNLGALHDPERVGLWLHTTARRECLAALRRAERDRPAGDGLEGVADDSASPAEAVLQAERAQRVRLALSMMHHQCRALLELLIVREPPARYAEVSDRLSIAVGTIGPRRRRCLDKLRHCYSAINVSGGRLP